MSQAKKIISLGEYSELTASRSDKTVGLCHGAFDILHYGHIIHFEAAKRQCDLLVVSVTDDTFVKKSPIGVYHTISQRIKMIANQELVDFVICSPYATGEEILQCIRPDYYFKGSDYAEIENQDASLLQEISVCNKYGGEVVFTDTEKLSSTFILNNILDDKRKSIRQYLSDNNITPDTMKIEEVFNTMSELEAVILGETIIDQYSFGTLTGLSSKYTAVSFLEDECVNMIGGAGALAPIAREYLKKTYLPAPDLGSVGLNLVSGDGLELLEAQMPLVTKKRFISSTKRERLFEVVNITAPKNGHSQRNSITNFLAANPLMPIIAFDFGHGLFEEIDLDRYALDRFVAVNVQANSTNYPYNDVNKYQNYSMITLDERELRLTMRDGSSPVEKLILKFLDQQADTTDKHYFFTLGPRGAWGAFNGQLVSCPALVKDVVDATGSGDIFHMVAGTLSALKIDLAKTLFVASLFAGLYAQIEGHSSELSKPSIVRAFEALR